MNDIRVLEVNVNDHSYNGVFSLVKNVIQHKPHNLKVDIACFEHFENKNNLLILNKYKTRVFFIGESGNKVQQQKIMYMNLYHFLIANKYDYVHIHSDVANKLLILGLAAKKAGVKNIIFHSHASNVDGRFRFIKRIIHKVSAPFLKKIGTKFVAVSNIAGRWMYPNISSNEIILIKNGINLNKFKFNYNRRVEVRNKLGLNNKLVIGNVGRFAYQKNHLFLLKVFKEYLKVNPNSILLLIGEGKDKNKIIDKARKYGIRDKIIFYGTSNRVNELLQAMDVFLLPSHFEGLPIVGVEAQAADLPVIFSDKITREVKILNTTKYLPIKKRYLKNWITFIEKNKNLDRVDTSLIMKKNGFSINDTVNQFINLYKEN